MKAFLKKYKATILLALGSFLIWFVSRFMQLNTNDQEATIRVLQYFAWISGFIALGSIAIIHKKPTVFSIILFPILIFCVDLVYYFMDGCPVVYEGQFEHDEYFDTGRPTYLGWVPAVNTVTEQLLVIDGDTSFHNVANIDEYQRRVVPESWDTIPNDKHALWFGCSVGFGYGLPDTSTMPYLFQLKEQEYTSYCYASNGFGTNQMLSRLQHEDLTEQVKEGSGYGFYIFNWGHIARNIADYHCYTEWCRYSPYYDINDESFEFKGSFQEGRSLSWWYEILYECAFVRYYGLNFPNELKEEHLDFTVRMVKRSQELYNEQFPDGEFYLVMHPGGFHEMHDLHWERFKELLEEHEVQYVFLYDLYPQTSEYLLVGDPHPNRYANELFIEAFSDELGRP